MRKINAITIKIDGENYEAKQCSACRNIKILAEFNKQKDGACGRTSRCKSCLSKSKGLKNEWDKEKIKSKINEIYNNENDISKTYMVKNYQYIYKKAIELFGSWKKAVEISTGLDYHEKVVKTKHGYWTEEKVIKKIKEIYKQTQQIKLSELKKRYGDVYFQAEQLFGSWKNAVEESGLDYYSLVTKKINYWDKSKIIKTVKDMFLKKYAINSANISTNHPDLYAISCRLFGSWENTIIAANIDYTEIREDRNNLSYIGILFEQLVGEIYRDLKHKYEKNKKFDDCIPDFVFNQYHWGDAKLSDHTIFSCNTLKKYLPKCKFLTIVFLRGKKDMDKMIAKKTRLISVHKLIKQLPKHKQLYYLEGIKRIENQINDIETNNKKLC